MLEKSCARCRRVKPSTAFHKRSRSSDGLDHYCAECKKVRYEQVAERERQRRRNNYAKNRERELAANKNWRTNNAEAMRQACRNWRTNNPEAQYQASMVWARNNPHKRAAAQVKRYAAQRQRTPAWLTQDDFRAIEFFYELSEAMTVATGVRHSVDHVVPLQGANVSGLHVPWNLEVIPKNDNARKGNRYVE